MDELKESEKSGTPEEKGDSLETEAMTLEAADTMQTALKEANDKYLRLYAEFENYKKKVLKDKDELVKYSHESLVYELLPVLDSMEMALKHATGSGTEVNSLAQGVENTERELLRTLEKFGLTAIESMEKPFDPSYHHAMSQVERDDMEANMVVEEFRKGYLFKEKVLRPSLVSVSKKTAVSE